MPNALLSMIHKSKTLSEIFDEETKPKHTAKTVASSLKFEIDALTEQLRKTVSYK